MVKDHVVSKMTSISRAKKTIKRLRTLITKHELKGELKLDRNNLDVSMSKKQIEYARNISFAQKVNHEVPRQASKRRVPVRTPGDGNETSLYFCQVRTPGDGEETNNIAKKERSFLNTGFISEHCDREKASKKVDLNKCALFKNKNLFFTDDARFDVDKTVIIDNVNEAKLNECLIYDDDSESNFEDDSECESICELEMNVLETCEDNTKLGTSQIKAMFTKTDLNARLINEDDSMESFMNTFYRD